MSASFMVHHSTTLVEERFVNLHPTTVFIDSDCFRYTSDRIYFRVTTSATAHQEIRKTKTRMIFKVNKWSSKSPFSYDLQLAFIHHVYRL
jgi:hypothetical protein